VENKEKAIIYCRVSTSEQAELGYSLASQEKCCLDYARAKNLDVADVFVERGVSAKTMDRPQLRELIRYISKEKVQYLIVYKVDRLSRDVTDFANLNKILGKCGVQLVSTTEEINNTAFGKFTTHLLASLSQLDNDIRSERTTDGMKQATRKGMWLFRVPFGYNSFKKNGKGYLVQNEDSTIVKEIFELYDRGYRIYEIEKIFKLKGKSFSKQFLSKILRSPVYKGKIRIEKWFEEEEIEGAHKPIIDEATFDRIQEILKRKNVMKNKKLRLHPDFPLRGLLFCPNCNNKLTGSFSRGRLGKKYGYYHCITKGCTFKSLRKELVEEGFKSFINTLRPDDRLIDLFSEIIKDVYHKRNKALEDNIKKWDKDALRIDDDIKHIISMHKEELLDDDDFRKRYQSLKQKRRETEYKITETIAEVENIDEYLAFGGRLIRDLPEFWIKSPVEHKDILQKLMFPEGITFDGERFGTTKIATIFNVFRDKNIDESTMVAHSILISNTLLKEMSSFLYHLTSNQW
jgi:site-specific DNA recombinase